MTAVPCSDPEAIVTEARRWIGTPYCHQASCIGAGADCLGLVRGVWRAMIGQEPEDMPAYSPDWAEGAGDERLLEAARRHLIEIPRSSCVEGDVLLFRMISRGPVKHAAILTSGPLERGRMIHAYSGHTVCETSLSPPWSRRLDSVFRFPMKV